MNTFYKNIEDEKIVRIHVGVSIRKLFIFTTGEMNKAIAKGGWKKVKAYQPNISEPTSFGLLVPPDAINNLETVDLNLIGGLEKFWKSLSEAKSTSDKGEICVKIIANLIYLGKLPIFQPYNHIEIIPSTDVETQCQGIDIRISNQNIQIKHDFLAGDSVKGSGKLYLEIMEKNPLKMY